MSPGASVRASSAPARSVPSGPAVSSVRVTQARAQREAGAEQERPTQGERPGFDARVGQGGAWRGRGRLRTARCGGRLRRGRRRGRGRRHGGTWRRRRGRLLRLLVAERIVVLIVAGALREGGRGREGDHRGGDGEGVPERHWPRSVDRTIGYGAPAMAHILLLTDRDWTHPQGGGTGANLFGQVIHWLEWGHRVTVVAGTYEGAERVSSPAPGLELHHMGSRLTVFPRAAWAVRRGLARDADVVLEVVNGIAFFTPVWLGRKPRVTLVHHIHKDHYVTELGRVGSVAALALETVPLKLLYSGGSPFLT